MKMVILRILFILYLLVTGVFQFGLSIQSESLVMCDKLYKTFERRRSNHV